MKRGMPTSIVVDGEKTEVSAAGLDIGDGCPHISLLHRLENLFGLSAQRLFDDFDEPKQRFGTVIAEIIDRVTCPDLVRLWNAIAGRENAAYDVIDVGEIRCIWPPLNTRIGLPATIASANR